MSTEPSKNKSNHAESSKHTARGEVEAANKLREFVRYGSPGSWLEYGEELRDAAEVLWGAEQEGLRVDVRLDSDHSIKQSSVVYAISRPYLLLAGFSLINILKGLIVAEKPTQFSGDILSEELRKHNVRLLCAKVRSV